MQVISEVTIFISTYVYRCEELALEHFQDDLQTPWFFGSFIKIPEQFGLLLSNRSIYTKTP